MRITLCGSARFEDAFKRLNKALTLAGHVVYSLAVFPSDEVNKEWYTKDEKETLDLVHLAKIDNSDAIVVIDGDIISKACSYIGESTTKEIAWASMKSKRQFTFSRCGYSISNLLRIIY